MTPFQVLLINMDSYKAEYPSVHDSVRRTVEKARDFLRKAGFRTDRVDDLLIAVSEIVNNAVVHGNKGEPDKRIKVSLTVDPNNFIFSVIDEGKGFKPESVEDPTKEENLRAVSGRGLFIASNLVDRIYFEKLDSGWKVEISAVNKV